MISRRHLFGMMTGAVALSMLSRPASAFRFIFPQTRWLVFHGIRMIGPTRRLGVITRYPETNPIMVSGVERIGSGHWFHRDAALSYGDMATIERLTGQGVFNWTVTLGKRPSSSVIASMPVIPAPSPTFVL